MRLDHIAYRVADRNKTAKFFQEVFGYKITDEFSINFDNDEKAQCLVLSPPEQLSSDLQKLIYSYQPNLGFFVSKENLPTFNYHLAPEIFISDGSEGSLIKEWVKKRDGVGGIHHLAYQVNSVEKKVKEMKEKGYFEFLTEEPIKCDELIQIFTKPSELTGVIYEFIERGKNGFCKDSVKELMESTKNL